MTHFTVYDFSPYQNFAEFCLIWPGLSRSELWRIAAVILTEVKERIWVTFFCVSYAIFRLRALCNEGTIFLKFFSPNLEFIKICVIFITQVTRKFHTIFIKWIYNVKQIHEKISKCSVLLTT